MLPPLAQDRHREFSVEGACDMSLADCFPSFLSPLSSLSIVSSGVENLACPTRALHN